MALSKDGYRLRELIAEGGFEVTPDELDISLQEAHERVGGGRCDRCGKGNEDTELHWGVCFKCMMAEPDVK